MTDHQEPGAEHPSVATYRPPGRQLPGIVALERVLARDSRVAVAVLQAAVYSRHRTRCHRCTRPSGEGLDPRIVHGGFGLKSPRLRSCYPDGWGLSSETTEPALDVPSVTLVAARGARDTWWQSLWWRPVPTEGPLTLECDWPGAGVRGEPIEVPVDEIRAAKRRCVPL